MEYGVNCVLVIYASLTIRELKTIGRPISSLTEADVVVTI